MIQSLLVDSGATSHIISDKSKFISFGESFVASSHYVELANETRANNVAIGRGDAGISLCDAEGKAHKVILKNALCISTYKQDIFSVQSAAENGVSVEFTPKFSQLMAPDGIVFNIKKNGSLYFLNNINAQKMSHHSVLEWHEIMGHYNIRDVIKLLKMLKV